MDKDRILIIPRHLVFVRFIDIPSTDDDEITKMVEFQAVKEVPYSKDEIVTSFRNLGSYKEGFSSVMLVIVKKKMLEEMIQKKNAGRIEHLRLFSELLYLFLLKKGIIETDSVILVMHIGETDSEIMIVDKTRPIFSRGFENSERFLEEIDRSVLAYEKDKSNPEIQHVIVVHALNTDIKAVNSHVKEHFRVPVNFYEYSRDDLTSSEQSLEIDLLPKEISQKKENLQKRYQLIITSSLIGFSVLMMLAYFSFKIYEKTRFINMLSAKILQMQSEVEGLDTFLRKTKIAKSHREQGDFIIGVLKETYSLIPRDIIISGLDYDGKDSVSYKGSSRDMSYIFTFVKELEKLKNFNKVEVKYATKRKVKGEEFTDFNIQCQLNR